MKNGKSVLTANEAPKEDDTVGYEAVLLNKKWSFFEGYENANYSQSIDWRTLVKLVYTFDDIISFWQFWNNSTYSKFSEIFNNGERIRYFYETKKRINSINVFVDGIYPAWEDPENTLSYCLTYNYEIRDLKDIPSFLSAAENLFLKLLMIILGAALEGSDYVNGIRFIDKSSFQTGKKNFFKIEIWVNKRITSDSVAKEDNLYDRIRKKLNELLEASCYETIMK